MADCRVIHADSREALRAIDAESIDAVVTDPPYALVSIGKRFGADNAAPAAAGVYARSAAGFMGKKWDTGETAFDPAFWAEVLRVLKPGAHLIAFGGTRTYHRLVCAIEDGGFEIRDQLAWIFGSGFPKSHDVSKGIDRAAGAERERLRPVAVPRGQRDGTKALGGYWQKEPWETSPATESSRQWQGWGTALKPAWETVCLAVKPFPQSVEHARLLADLERLEARLWCLLFASAANESSASSQSEFVAACAIAQWSADDATNTLAALCGQTDTPLFVSALNSSLNIVSSWKRIWADDWTRASTSTTETESSTTTDWRTLRFCLSEITPQSIIQAHSQPNGPSASVHPALSYFDAFASRLSATQTLSALAPAMSLEAISSPVGGAKPSLEPICLARRPLSGTVAANVLQHGTGALNIDASRIEASDNKTFERDAGDRSREQYRTGTTVGAAKATDLGRWPANVLHDGSEEVLRGFPESDDGVAVQRNGGGQRIGNLVYGGGGDIIRPDAGFGGGGSAARFFYSAKADADDRLGSKHPTVKPVDLMAYLVKLVTPPGGVVLDPFAGSGTTGMACMREGFRSILIEREAEYVADIRARIKHVHGHDAPLFAPGHHGAHARVMIWQGEDDDAREPEARREEHAHDDRS